MLTIIILTVKIILRYKHEIIGNHKSIQLSNTSYILWILRIRRVHGSCSTIQKYIFAKYNYKALLMYVSTCMHGTLQVENKAILVLCLDAFVHYHDQVLKLPFD